MFYPVMLDLEKLNIAIIGGGRIAYRKAKSILEYTDKLKVVSPYLCDDFTSLKKEKYIEVHIKEYDSTDIEDCDLVYVATDDADVNRSVVEYCNDKKILVNSVDNHDNSSFINMGSFITEVDGEDVLIGVSCMGKNPKLVKKMTGELREYLGVKEEK